MTAFYPAAGKQDPLSLDELVHHLDEEVDFTDVDSIRSAHVHLQRVCSDPGWFIDFLNSELINNISSDETYGNRYTSNSYILARSRKPHQFFIRANTWLPEKDPLRSDIDRSLFAEDLLHDHAFDLLTGGLLGPGYQTRIYHYDYDRCVGYIGEEIPCLAEFDFQLARGSVLFMEKNVSIHRQIPPAEISVSLNVLCQNIEDPMRRQYEFELVRDGMLAIKSIHYSTVQNPAATENLLNICGTFFNEETKQIMIDLYGRLADAPERNEACIIMLLEWFRQHGIASSCLKPIRSNLTPHLRREMDLLVC